MVEGSTFKSQVSTMSVAKDTLAACGFDDKLLYVAVAEKKFKDAGALPLPSQPYKILMLNENITVVGCVSEITVFVDGAHACSVTTGFEVKGMDFYGNSDGSYTILAGGNVIYEKECFLCL